MKTITDRIPPLPIGRTKLGDRVKYIVQVLKGFEKSRNYFNGIINYQTNKMCQR